MVILDPQAKGHVIQRMRNPKIAVVRYVQPKARHMNDSACLWNYKTDQHEISGEYLDNENDAVLWRHKKSKMADGRHFEDR